MYTHTHTHTHTNTHTNTNKHTHTHTHTHTNGSEEEIMSKVTASSGVNYDLGSNAAGYDSQALFFLIFFIFPHFSIFFLYKLTVCVLIVIDF